MDDLYVKENLTGLASSAFAAGDNGVLLLVGNAGQKEGAAVTFELPFAARSAQGFTEDGFLNDVCHLDGNRVMVRAAGRLTAVYAER
jgi:hypothetical protein